MFMHVRLYFDVALFVVMLVTGIAITLAAALGPVPQEAGMASDRTLIALQSAEQGGGVTYDAINAMRLRDQAR